MSAGLLDTLQVVRAFVIALGTVPPTPVPETSESREESLSGPGAIT